MKNKFIRINSFITDLIAVFLCLSAVAFGVLTYHRILISFHFVSVCFLLIEILLVVTAVLTVISNLRCGVRFGETALEFTNLDSNNIYSYSEISAVETHKDTKVSFKKNTVDRYSSLIFYLNNNTVSTVELGMTSKKKLNKIKNEIEKRL